MPSLLNIWNCPQFSLVFEAVIVRIKSVERSYPLFWFQNNLIVFSLTSLLSKKSHVSEFHGNRHWFAHHQVDLGHSLPTSAVECVIWHWNEKIFKAIIILFQDPWSMAFSKSRNRKYFYNTITKESSFECPPDFCATYRWVNHRHSLLM